MQSKEISEFLDSRSLIILDGAMGTELERRGYRTSLPLWSAMANIEAPVQVHQIHKDYIDAGADIITANTFRTTRHTFDKVRKGAMAAHVTRLAVELAHEARAQAGRQVLLAASLAPLEDCFRPDLVPSAEIVRDAYTEQIDLLISTEVDFILAETMINQSEITFISRYLHEKNTPFMMSFTVQDGRLLDGTALESVIPEVIGCNPLALLLNCRSCAEISKNLPLLQSLFHGITGAYGNGPGHPDDELGWYIAEGGIEEYVEAAKHWIQLGVRIIGGCCGTTPEHIRAIGRME
jgi:homocysteine S-methyltransferase